MRQFKVKTKGFRQLENAIKRNPGVVKRELGDFFVDVMRIYNKGIIRNPWRVGGNGGGAPVKTGYLRDTHDRDIKTWHAKVFVDTERVPYAMRVHEGFKGTDSRGRTYNQDARPWLDHVFDTKMGEVKRREKQLADNIIKDLGK